MLLYPPFGKPSLNEGICINMSHQMVDGSDKWDVKSNRFEGWCISCTVALHWHFSLLQSKIAGSGLRMTVIWRGEKSGWYKWVKGVSGWLVEKCSGISIWTKLRWKAALWLLLKKWDLWLLWWGNSICAQNMYIGIQMYVHISTFLHKEDGRKRRS